MTSTFRYRFRPFTPRHLPPLLGMTSVLVLNALLGTLNRNMITTCGFVGLPLLWLLGTWADYMWQQSQHRIREIEREIKENQACIQRARDQLSREPDSP